LRNMRFHILHILFIIILPIALLSFDFSQEKIPGNYPRISQNPLGVGENYSSSSKAFNDPITDCSAYLDDYIYLSKINKGQLFSYLLWDSNSGTGVPFLARWTTRAFSPLSIPFYFLSIFYALFVNIWLKIVIGGLGVYILGLTYNLLPSTALLASVAFQTMGLFIYTPLHPTTDTIAVAPYYLTILHLFVRGKTKLWLFFSLPIALMLLGGRIQPILIILVFSLLYLLLVDLFSDKTYKQIIREFLLLVSAWILGVGLTLFQILPYIEWANLKFNIIPSGETSITSLMDLISFLIPVSPNGEKENFILQKITTSPILLILLLVPLYISERELIKNEIKKYLEIFWILSVFIFILVIITSSKLLLNTDYTTFIRSITIMDTGWLLILASTLLIGLALESWNLFNPDECRICTKKLISYAPFFWIILFILLLVAKLSSHETFTHFWYYYLIGLILLLVICAYFLLTLFSPSPTNGIYSIIIILLISSHFIYSDYKPYISYSLLPKFQEVCAQLKSFGNRIVSLNNSDIIPNHSDQINILPPPPEKRTSRLNAFIEQTNNEPKLWLRAGANVFTLPSNANKFTNNIFSVRDKLKLINQQKSGISVFSYEEPTNRGYVIYSWKSFSESNNLPQLSPNLPHIVENIGNDVQGSSEVLPVEIEEISPTNIVLNIPKTKPGILVLADTYYPGWEATIDGKPIEIFPVDITFRGIELSEGEHKVEISYSCNPLYTGGILSVIFLFIWLILAKFTFKFSYKLPYG